jgi:hypothetical protein
MLRKWIHRALKGASLTTALFVFQACYGTPPSVDMMGGDPGDVPALTAPEDSPEEAPSLEEISTPADETLPNP